MSIQDLYRKVIMEHYKSPLNKGLLDDPTYKTINLHNPSCGDEINIQVKVENGIIKDIRQDGKGCSICCSSASVMTDTLMNLTLDEAMKVIKDFFELVQGHEVENEEALKEAIVYQGVSSFPARIKCATLSWHAIEKGLLGEKDE